LISLLIIIYLSFIMLGLPNVLGSAWPVMYGRLGVSAASAGIISMIISAATILGALLCDKVVRRFGASKVVLISLITTATALIGFSMGTHFILLCLWSIPLGIGMGLIDASLNNVVALHYEAKHMNWLHAFWGVGASIGPIIMAFFLARASWEAGYLSIGLIQFAFVVIFILNFKLWKKIAPVNSLENEEQEQKSSSLKQLIQLAGVKQSLLVIFFYCAIEATVGLWASSYLVIARYLEEEVAALWVAIYFGGITIGRFMAGFLSSKLSHKQLIGLGSSLIGLGVAILFLPVPNSFLLISLFLIGFGCAPIFPSLMHETPNNFGTNNSQAIIGIQMAFAYVGSMFMPPLFGILAEHTSYHLFPFYIALFLILMIIMKRWLYQLVK